MTTPLPLTLAHRTITGDAGPHLLITAGVHGDEYEPMAAVRALAQRFDARTLRGRVTLVPIVNQSAFARAARCGDDGLDLARVCPGDVDGSVTMKAAAALTRMIGEAD